MTPELARSQLDLVAEQLRRIESRAGRRAVRISVAIPPEVDAERALEILSHFVRQDREHPIDIDIVHAQGRTRLLTVDFELQDSL